ncbi:MAG: ABC transporter permease [Pseudomonadota bacterium]
MLHPRFLPLVFKYVVRHRVRSCLTIAGVATAMFVFYSVQAMQDGFRSATEESAGRATLVVYRQDRYCPFSSLLPEDYGKRIAAIPGVKSVAPVKLVVSNCRTSLDVAVFRGVHEDAFESGLFDIRITEGSLDNWKRRSDAALVGERLAKRRGLKVGDSLNVSGITISVAGILESSDPQDRNTAYTHLGFIQRAAGNNAGIVTQFNVAVNDPKRLQQVAAAIDEEFRKAQDPTSTWSDKAFTARVVSDIIEIVRFTKWLGWGCIVGVFALVGNAIVLSVRDRIRDHAVLQTLGYDQGLIGRLILAEGMVLSMVGGLSGILAGMAVAGWGAFSLSVEGLSINIEADLVSTLMGLGLSVLLGAVAGLVPAWQASHRSPASCFRAV